jgi:hypothetical protein
MEDSPRADTKEVSKHAYGRQRLAAYMQKITRSIQEASDSGNYSLLPPLVQLVAAYASPRYLLPLSEIDLSIGAQLDVRPGLNMKWQRVVVMAHRGPTESARTEGEASRMRTIYARNHAEPWPTAELGYVTPSPLHWLLVCPISASFSDTEKKDPSDSKVTSVLHVYRHVSMHVRVSPDAIQPAGWITEELGPDTRIFDQPKQRVYAWRNNTTPPRWHRMRLRMIGPGKQWVVVTTPEWVQSPDSPKLTRGQRRRDRQRCTIQLIICADEICLTKEECVGDGPVEGARIK